MKRKRDKYQSTAIEGEIWDPKIPEKISCLVNDDGTVEIVLVRTTRAPENFQTVKI